MNQSSPLAEIAQLVGALAPVTALAVSALALWLSIRSFNLARTNQQEQRATAGRSERVALQLRATKTCRNRWGGGDGDLSQTSQAFHDSVSAIEQSAAVNAAAMAMDLYVLDDLFRPGPNAEPVVRTRTPAFAAETMLAHWVEDPFDRKTLRQISALALRPWRTDTDYLAELSRRRLR